MQNWWLDDIISNQLNNLKLVEGLKLVKSRPITGIKDTITGNEQFPEEIITPRKQDGILPNDIYNLLVDYYNNVYDLEFVTIADSIESRLQFRHPIIVRLIINQYGHNNVADVFPGQVQYYLEHKVNLPSGKQPHKLAFVKWYLLLWKNRFYEIGRDSIIPIHHIYSRFIPSKFIVGQRNPVIFMAVIPINRHFHL
ncbi:hypothetical protein RhiirC2_800113 [Rhizophagus irregularis]|uniref:Uncharacterized protein n=1 Tax=Rhizophagus irregularis TaxID=588596 RepID=A0A2N1M434_9GLOM|nr:hypothetical protein RhiirC2_800113 [Rhizophagus irregularis]